MLIYNNNKEFVDATNDTLKRIGYNSIQELQEDAVDLADLFENKPGFVHNFKNFSWIDFIIHSEQDNIKARIRCNGKIYETGFKIDTHYFIPGDEEDTGFAIELTDVIVIGDDETSQERDTNAPLSIKAPSVIQKNDLPISEPVPQAAEVIPISMPDMSIDIPETSIQTQSEAMSFDMDVMDDVDDTPLPDLELVQEIQPQAENFTSIQTEAPVNVASSEVFDKPVLETAADYVYDPSIAADELGLPTDLIDEFVGDFIVQAKKFRPDLEEAISNEDFDNIQILSHKLKGVAANLRIEDALEVLTVINSNKDVENLQKHLNYFYHIVSILEFGDQAPAQVSQESHQDSTSNIPDYSTDLIPDSQESPRLDLDDMDLDIIPLDRDFPAETVDSSTQTDDVEDDFTFDLLPSDTNDIEPLEMNFDEPDITLKDDPFQTPEHEPLELDMEDFTLNTAQEEPALEPLIEVQPTLFSHIDVAKFDVTQATESLDVSVETLKSYVDDFIDQANVLKPDLESALTSKDLNEVKNLATELIGMSDALYMTYASQLLNTLQTTDDLKEAIQSAKDLFIFIREL